MQDFKENPETAPCPTCGRESQPGFTADMNPPIQAYSCDCGTHFQLQEGEPYRFSKPTFIGEALEILLWAMTTPEGQSHLRESEDSKNYLAACAEKARKLIECNEVLEISKNPKNTAWRPRPYLVTRPEYLASPTKETNVKQKETKP